MDAATDKFIARPLLRKQRLRKNAWNLRGGSAFQDPSYEDDLLATELKNAQNMEVHPIPCPVFILVSVHRRTVDIVGNIVLKVSSALIAVWSTDRPQLEEKRGVPRSRYGLSSATRRKPN
uniref:Uncharacterized protein n=1 Tax=Steinernema glaseri TaxID=37863 RepID=A0A1I7YL92_9BILA